MSKTGPHTNKVRNAVFAGRFYPASQAQLLHQLETFFSHAKKSEMGIPPQALLSPHAGYIFSGEVAASAFNQLPENFTCKRVFILASSHHYNFPGASFCKAASYKTPLGEIRTDTQIIKQLVKTGNLFRFHPEAHSIEHSLEVQLPFLQYKMGSDFLLVPIILGTKEAADCEKMAHMLEPWFKPGNLFVISTDFSHYPSYNSAVELDFKTAQVICRNNPQELLEFLHQNINIKNLATPLCGWTSVVTLLYLTQYKDVEYQMIHYQNSGDNELYGDKEKVVGYWAIAIYGKENKINISRPLQSDLLKKARDAIAMYLKTGNPVPQLISGYPGKEAAGMFVSIYVKGQLRGCIGNLTNEGTMDNAVRHLAVSASCDERFENLKMHELKDMQLEISLLSPLRKINSIDEITPGKHGIFIRKETQTGIFLPKVIQHTHWSVEEFLGHCSQDKAGIGWEGWRSAEIFVFEAFVFGD